MSQRAYWPGSQKKPRGKALSAADQFINSIVSSVRVVVEHVIAGVKRCRIVKDVLRLTQDGVSDLVMEIACGLHNLRVSCRHPLPAVTLLGQVNQT
jgi:DDE superfamily endonuclease